MTKKTNSPVKALLVEIDGTEHRLTPEAAKALYEALGELVGAPSPAPVIVDRPLPDWPRLWHYRQPYTTWNGSGQQITMSAASD